jgi:hypothetical protein
MARLLACHFPFFQFNTPWAQISTLLLDSISCNSIIGACALQEKMILIFSFLGVKHHGIPCVADESSLFEL